MGNDGGTIARGQDLKAVFSHGTRAENPELLQTLKSSNDCVCLLSALPLHGHAIVADHKGELYIKEKILEYLIGRKLSKLRDAHGKLAHIRGLNDLVDLLFSWTDEGTLMCPVTRKSRTTKTVFVGFRSCSCVISKAAIPHLEHLPHLEEFDLNPTKAECPRCGGEYCLDRDLLILSLGEEPHRLQYNERIFSHLRDLLLSNNKKPLKTEKDGVKKRKRGGVTTKVKKVKS